MHTSWSMHPTVIPGVQAEQMFITSVAVIAVRDSVGGTVTTTTTANDTIGRCVIYLAVEVQFFKLCKLNIIKTKCICCR